MRPFDTPLPRDTAEAGSGALGELPVWDLTDLYAAPDAPEIAADLDRVEAAGARLRGPLSGPACRTRCRRVADLHRGL